jgi:magnesium chelatase accessory protein
MERRLEWDQDGADWPHRERSRFVEAAGLRWHVQRFAPQTAGAPRALLIHGTGASTHSWRDVVPLLQPHFEVMAMDLPGHAYTSLPVGGTFSSQLSLPGMARALAQLLQVEGYAPDLVVGHSAGAAIGARLCLDGAVQPRLLVSLNGALMPLGGLAGRMFSPAARLMAVLPGMPRLFAWRAGDPMVLQRLLDGTGSQLDARGRALYARLAANPGHVEGALGMMAHWDLPALAEDLPALGVPLLLVVGLRDTTVPPQEADRLMAHLATRAHGRAPVKRIALEGLGHLAHEERPHAVVAPLLAAWQDVI